MSAHASQQTAVTFSDPQFTKAEVDAMPAGVQAQMGMLSELDHEIWKGRERLVFGGGYHAT
jgi:ABC-type Zn2+ transport system substrate-binding protein/surface adhesin